MHAWAEVKARIVADMTPEQRDRWDKALDRARKRYINEIRKYRGIPRLRAMYRRRKK